MHRVYTSRHGLLIEINPLGLFRAFLVRYDICCEWSLLGMTLLPFKNQGPRSYFESGGGGGVTSDSKWGGAENTFFSVTLYNFQKSGGGGGGS